MNTCGIWRNHDSDLCTIIPANYYIIRGTKQLWMWKDEHKGQDELSEWTKIQGMKFGHVGCGSTWVSWTRLDLCKIQLKWLGPFFCSAKAGQVSRGWVMCVMEVNRYLGNRYAISGLGFEWTNGCSAGVFLVGSWSFGLRTIGRCNMWPCRCQPQQIWWTGLLDMWFGLGMKSDR